MASADNPDIGKSPDRIDQEQPDDEAVMEALETETQGKDSLPPETGEETLPSKQEMWQVIQQQETMITHLHDKVQELEASIQDQDDALDEASTHIQDAAQQLKEGKLSGEAGEELLMELNTFTTSTKTDARATQLYYAIVRERKVGVRVSTGQVVNWVGIETANPNQTAHRVMERLETLTQEDHLIGQVETYLWRGNRVVEMQTDD